MDKKRPFDDDDSDLDNELNDYEPSDSDDDYEGNEKLLLERARTGKSLDDNDDDDEDDDDSEEEVLGIYSSEGEDDKKNADSDIEGKEDDDKLPDPKAWGKRKKDYYYTDYVDQDYQGFVGEEEEDAALMEEKEARTLQSRLAAQLDDVDLSLGLISADVGRKGDSEKVDDKEEDGDLDGDVIKTDLSKLSKREKLALFKKESPEFFGLVRDYNERLTFAKDKLFPIMKLIKCGDIPSDLPCAKFVEIKTNLTLNYCVNLAFYLVLKKKRIRVKDHPVIGRLVKYRTLLQKMDELESSEFIKQLNYIVERLKSNERVSFISDSSDSKKQKRTKAKLKLLSSSSDKSDKRKKESEIKSNIDVTDDDDDNLDDLSLDNDSDEGDQEPPVKKSKSADTFNVDEEGKRPITYEIAKNKGLTPHRKKEQRNPRVKHRNKYRKTLIRRKGQVRQVQNESSKYGGEIFGIKASVVKSRRFK